MKEREPFIPTLSAAFLTPILYGNSARLVALRVADFESPCAVDKFFQLAKCGVVVGGFHMFLMQHLTINVELLNLVLVHCLFLTTDTCRILQLAMGSVFVERPVIWSRPIVQQVRLFAPQGTLGGGGDRKMDRRRHSQRCCRQQTD